VLTLISNGILLPESFSCWRGGKRTRNPNTIDRFQIKAKTSRILMHPVHLLTVFLAATKAKNLMPDRRFWNTYSPSHKLIARVFINCTISACSSTCFPFRDFLVTSLPVAASTSMLHFGSFTCTYLRLFVAYQKKLDGFLMRMRS
jgi:hypothetical protein